MLLSYHKTATASSARDSFPASNVTDENPRTFWVARQNRPGESLTVDLGRAYEVKAIQVNYADYKSGLYGTDSTVFTQFRLRVSRRACNGKRSRIFRASDATVQTRTSSSRHRRRARFVRYEHIHVGAANLAISDIRVFGNGAGSPPATPDRPDGASRSRRAQRDHHMAARARSRRLQRALGNLAIEVVSDLPALRRSGDDARAPRADGRAGILGRDRELRRERRFDPQPRRTDSIAASRGRS